MLQEKSVEGQNALQKIKRSSENLQDNTKKAKDAILQREKEILEEFTKKLKYVFAALIDEVDRKHNEVDQELVKQHDDMKAYVGKVNESLELAKNMIEKGSNEEIFAHSLKKKCPKSTWPVHHGLIQCQLEK